MAHGTMDSPRGLGWEVRSRVSTPVLFPRPAAGRLSRSHGMREGNSCRPTRLQGMQGAAPRVFPRGHRDVGTGLCSMAAAGAPSHGTACIYTDHSHAASICGRHRQLVRRSHRASGTIQGSCPTPPLTGRPAVHAGILHFWDGLPKVTSLTLNGFTVRCDHLPITRTRPRPWLTDSPGSAHVQVLGPPRTCARGAGGSAGPRRWEGTGGARAGHGPCPRESPRPAARHRRRRRRRARTHPAGATPRRPPAGATLAADAAAEGDSAATQRDPRRVALQSLSGLLPAAGSDDGLKFELATLDTDTLNKLTKIKGQQQEVRAPGAMRGHTWRRMPRHPSHPPRAAATCCVIPAAAASPPPPRASATCPKPLVQLRTTPQLQPPPRRPGPTSSPESD
jgi:hypothetical protein